MNGLNNTSLHEAGGGRPMGGGGEDKTRGSTYLHKSIAHPHVTKETGSLVMDLVTKVTETLNLL